MAWESRLLSGVELVDTEIALTRWKLVILLTPVPLVMPTKNLRLPIAERQAFITDVSSRLAVADPGVVPLG
jgi:hypothetical protein